MVAAEVILASIKLSMMLPHVWVLPSILLTEYWIIAGLLLGYCQFRICGTAGAAADLKRNAGDPHP